MTTLELKADEWKDDNFASDQEAKDKAPSKKRKAAPESGDDAPVKEKKTPAKKAPSKAPAKKKKVEKSDDAEKSEKSEDKDVEGEEKPKKAPKKKKEKSDDPEKKAPNRLLQKKSVTQWAKANNIRIAEKCLDLIEQAIKNQDLDSFQHLKLSSQLKEEGNFPDVVTNKRYFEEALKSHKNSARKQIQENVNDFIELILFSAKTCAQNLKQKTILDKDVRTVLDILQNLKIKFEDSD
jgi:histone H3/H4